MKKIKSLAITCTIALLLSTFTFGCKDPVNPVDPNNNNTEETTDTDDEDDDDGPAKGNGFNDEIQDENGTYIGDLDDEDANLLDSTLQAKIEEVSTGGTLNLDDTFQNKTIKVTKKMTLNGNGVSNVSVIVTPNVADGVKLKKFVNATITIKSGSAGSRNARTIARGGKDPDPNADPNQTPDDTGDKPKEIGDDNPKIEFEGCTFDKVTIKDDVSIIMAPNSTSNSEGKTTINEIELKNGIEQFVVIENEAENTDNSDKSLIKKLTLEDGIGEIDLVGARYEDVSFDGDFTQKVDLYYEKNTDTQVDNTFKTKVEQATTKINSNDVCAVKNGYGLFKYTLTDEQLEKANGQLYIILLTDSQVGTWLIGNCDSEHAYTWANVEHPYYEIAYTGAYVFDDFNTTEDSDKYHSVVGNTDTFVLTHANGNTDVTYLDDYQIYTRDALFTKYNSNELDIYLDLSKLIKSDLNVCAEKLNEANCNDDAFFYQPSKLSEIDLDEYKPYIVINSKIFTGDGNGGGITTPMEGAENFFTSTINTSACKPPLSKMNNYSSQNLDIQLYASAMDSCTSFPSINDSNYINHSEGSYKISCFQEGKIRVFTYSTATQAYDVQIKLKNTLSDEDLINSGLDYFSNQNRSSDSLYLNPNEILNQTSVWCAETVPVKYINRTTDTNSSEQMMDSRMKLYSMTSYGSTTSTALLYSDVIIEPSNPDSNLVVSENSFKFIPENSDKVYYLYKQE